MQARKLDRRITIQEVTETQDSYGEADPSWTTFKTVSAEVRPIRGKEFFMDMQVNAETDTVFTIRWLEGLSPKMRISYEGKYYNITSLKELGRRDGIEIYSYAEVA